MSRVFGRIQLVRNTYNMQLKLTSNQKTTKKLIDKSVEFCKIKIFRTTNPLGYLLDNILIIYTEREK